MLITPTGSKAPLIQVWGFPGRRLDLVLG